jgi:hypothetical protein
LRGSSGKAGRSGGCSRFSSSGLSRCWKSKGAGPRGCIRIPRVVHQGGQQASSLKELGGDRPVAGYLLHRDPRGERGDPQGWRNTCAGTTPSTSRGQTLAPEIRVRPSYISFLFRQAYGQSPSDYLTTLRLDKAKETDARKTPPCWCARWAEQVGLKTSTIFFPGVQEKTRALAYDFKS